MNKKLFSILLIVLMFVGIGFSKVSADEEETYLYTITFETGLYGDRIVDANGNTKTSVKLVPNIKFKDLGFSPDDYRPVISNNKYYFKGWHVYGQMGENASGVFAPYMPTDDTVADKDLILVATYGIKGEMCEYQVHYVNTAGEELLPTAVFYGNVGDTPVVAYRYIPGYIPNVTSITGTLQKGIPQEFTFVYTRVEVEENIIDEGETTIYNYPTRRTTTTQPTVVEEVEEEIEVVEEPAPEPAPAPTPEPVPEPEPIPEESHTIFDTIADAVVPLINFVNDTIEKNPVLGYSIAALLILFALLLVALIIYLIIFFIRRRRKNNDEEGPKPQMA